MSLIQNITCQKYSLVNSVDISDVVIDFCRHIGRGTVECISRIGAMVAPQFISLVTKHFHF